MGEIIKLPGGGSLVSEEGHAMICETCAVWEVLSAHFFVHSDNSFRCVQCGTSHIFANRENGDKKME
jgi:RNase P subunit RPR2